jgi:hypothetical protein
MFCPALRKLRLHLGSQGDSRPGGPGNKRFRLSGPGVSASWPEPVCSPSEPLHWRFSWCRSSSSHGPAWAVWSRAHHAWRTAWRGCALVGDVEGARRSKPVSDQRAGSFEWAIHRGLYTMLTSSWRPGFRRCGVCPALERDDAARADLVLKQLLAWRLVGDGYAQAMNNSMEVLQCTRFQSH